MCCALLTQLIHNGIVIPDVPAPLGLTLVVRGRPIPLTPKQEEMALAWARKLDTPYIQDPVFAANFMRDFSAALGVEPPLAVAEVDFGPCIRIVEAEREAKAQMPPEERKALAAQRKATREALKAKHGYAIVNGQRVELGAYLAEPSGIFMGRGQHPLRGRWKEGARQGDITLNLSPDAPRPEGDWAEIVWQPESLWVARWQDKLAGKQKYLWLSDTTPVKQEREASKFDKATQLDAEMERVRERIGQDLSSDNPRRRTLATVCYLIDALCLRVGDEKDPDEADTVGATTLRPEHLRIRPDGVVEFEFLGKDSVEWHKKLEPPQVVLDNLQELVRDARPSNATRNGQPTRDKPQLFPGVDSQDVNAYLTSILPGLTAKVFRTHHATTVVRESLSSSGVRLEHPEYVKWQATTVANLEAATLCNHTKKASGDWGAMREHYRERQLKAEERLAHCNQQVRDLGDALAELREKAREREQAASSPELRRHLRERHARQIEKARARLEEAKERRARAQDALGKIKAQMAIASKKRTWNLGTSLKSYIDPRVYHAWGQLVGYDVLARYYPTILQRKFAWVRTNEAERVTGLEDEGTLPFALRTCMAADLPAVVRLFRALQAAHPEALFPLETEEIARRYLPSLEKGWQEAFIALDEEGEVLGLVVLGPQFQQGDALLLDVQGFMRPGERDLRLGELLAGELRRRFRAYQAHHPKERVKLGTRDRSWFAYAPALAAALGSELSESSSGPANE